MNTVGGEAKHRNWSCCIEIFVGFKLHFQVQKLITKFDNFEVRMFDSQFSFAQLWKIYTVSDTIL